MKIIWLRLLLLLLLQKVGSLSPFSQYRGSFPWKVGLEPQGHAAASPCVAAAASSVTLMIVLLLFRCCCCCCWSCHTSRRCDLAQISEWGAKKLHWNSKNSTRWMCRDHIIRDFFLNAIIGSSTWFLCCCRCYCCCCFCCCHSRHAQYPKNILMALYVTQRHEFDV